MSNKLRRLRMVQEPMFAHADDGVTPATIAAGLHGYPALPLIVDDANLYLARRADYGASELDFGAVMDALFPNGLTIRGGDDWARYGVLHQIVSKLVRYCNNFPEFDHPDSLRDIRVYSAMLQALGGQKDPDK